jgi:chromosomal replication initiation ATPase DnaA
MLTTTQEKVRTAVHALTEEFTHLQRAIAELQIHNDNLLKLEADTDVDRALLSASIVCETTREEILSERKFPHLVHARILVMEYLVQDRHFSYPKTARILHRNHALIIRALKQIPDLLKYEPLFQTRHTQFRALIAVENTTLKTAA